MTERNKIEHFNRPVVDTNLVARVLEQHFGLLATDIIELNSYSDRNFHVLVDCEKCANENITSPSVNGYVLKFINDFPKSDNQVQIFNCLQHFQPVHGNMPLCPQIIKSINNKDKEIIHVKNTNETEDANLTIRLFNYIPGNLLLIITCSDKLLTDLGSKLALIHIALQQLPNMQDCDKIAFLTMEKMFLVYEKLFVVKDLELRQLILKILKSFEDEVVPASKHFQKGFIHYDLNEQNILINDESPDKIYAIIDWQDALHSCLAYDVAICMVYMCALGQTSIPKMSIETSTGLVLRAYQSERMLNNSQPLNDTEIEMLPILMASRMAQSIVMGLYHYFEVDQSNEYVLVSVPGFVRLLKLFVDIPKHDLIHSWRNE